jgi:S-layer protein (TIGR01567 family)
LLHIVTKEADTQVEDTNGTWNSSNFQGFRYDEELTVFQTPIDGAHRIILENNLVYSTSPLTRYYQLYIHKGEKVAGSENYSIIDWLGDEYVAVNGTPNKLTKLVLEQKSYETKTLQINEIWEMGDGYSLEVAEIDYHGGEAWLDLYKNGGPFNSKVVDNQSYWCVKDDIAGESKVPIFVTYLDKVTNNTIQLKYTWLISQDATVINLGEYFGVFEVKSISSDTIRLANDENVSLTRGSAIPLANDLKFEVEDTPTVRYCLVGTGEKKTGLVGDISYDSAIRTVTFDPVSNLMYDTNYISYITTVAEDLAGNSLIEDYEWEFKTMLYTTPSRNGGGGSSGGGTSGEDYYNIILSETDRQSVFKNSCVSFIFDMEGNIVRHINFTALNSAGTMAAKVEILNNTSTLVSTPPLDKVYKNLNIWVGNYGWATEKNIADTTVSFTVEKSWVTDNNIDETTIALYRYSDVTWHKLVTRKIAEDANSLQFEAETSGFSPFAVTGKKIMAKFGGEGIVAQPTATAEKTPVPTPTEKKGIPGFSLFAGFSVLLIAVQLLRKKK